MGLGGDGRDLVERQLGIGFEGKGVDRIAGVGADDAGEGDDGAGAFGQLGKGVELGAWGRTAFPGSGLPF